jgi:hypothetical protein
MPNSADTIQIRHPKITLFREAVLLERLYRAYRSDREFLRTTPNATMMIFLDAHEVKAFIDPDAPGILAGFIMNLELMAGDANRGVTVALRHDQILEGLLFNPSHVCGILPAHSEEMDREVAFRFNKWFDTVLKLVGQARREINEHREKARRLAQATQSIGNAELEVEFVRFFQTHAPALTAILRDDLGSSHRRLEAVMNDSKLTLFEDLPWEDFGVLPEDAEALRSLRPTPDSVRTLRDGLRVFDYRQNTVDANFVDASALSHIQLLRSELSKRGIDHIRVVLVSRARTLLLAARDMAKETKSEIFVRHPRMLALTSRDAEKLDAAVNLTLGMALDVWQAQVRAWPDDTADLAPLKAAGCAFLDAWDSFESSRLAVEAKWRENRPVLAAPGAGRRLAARLIQLFCTNENAETLLSLTLIEKFSEFGDTSSRFLLEAEHIALKARLTPATNGRVYVTPLAMGAVGPIQVERWPGLPALPADMSLEDIGKFVRGASERPLVWSLALACAGRWRQAAIFARGASQLADLEYNQVATADEARLLRAEIRRLGAGAPEHTNEEERDAAGRYAAAMNDLARVRDTNYPRRLREEAAQFLEAALLSVPMADIAAQLLSFFFELDQSADRSVQDEEKVRCFALMLLLYLYEARKQSTEPTMTDALRQHAKARHRDLLEALQRLQLDAVPHRARAMALIGYVLFGDPDRTPIVLNSALGRALMGPVNVPSDLRGELPDLLEGVRASPDQIGKFLHAELTEIWSALKRFHSPHLSLAPVPIPRYFREELTRRHPRVMQVAQPALDTNETIGLALMEGGPSMQHKAEIEPAVDKLKLAIDLAVEEKVDQHLLFYLRVAFLYARLIDVTFEPLFMRDREFRILIDEYLVLNESYERAALPNLRLNYIASNVTGAAQIAEDAIGRALEYVDDDAYYPRDSATGPHWLQSFVRRRSALLLLAEHPGAQRKWRGDRSTAEAEQEAGALNAACELLLDAERRDVAEVVDRAHALERQRRTNNVVFYASRMIERHGGREEAFDRLAPSGTLRRLVNRLLPTGIEKADDVDILHTVGCYFTATGRILDAHRAGRRISELIINEGKQMSGEGAEACAHEAFAWFMSGQRAEFIKSI